MKKVLSSIALFVLIACPCVSNAQSGRRPPKTPPTSVPAVQTPGSPKPAEKPKAAVTLILAMDRSEYASGSRPVNASNVMATMSSRLKENDSVAVDLVQRQINYAEAHRRATAEKEAFVVFLQVKIDTMTMGDNNPQPSLLFWVFSPVTGAIKKSGRTYPQVYRNRGVIVNPKLPGVYAEQQLRQAAREAAERILSAFNLH